MCRSGNVNASLDLDFALGHLHAPIGTKNGHPMFRAQSKSLVDPSADETLSDADVEAQIAAMIDTFDARLEFIEAKFDSLLSHLGMKRAA